MFFRRRAHSSPFLYAFILGFWILTNIFWPKIRSRRIASYAPSGKSIFPHRAGIPPSDACFLFLIHNFSPSLYSEKNIALFILFRATVGTNQSAKFYFSTALARDWSLLILQAFDWSKNGTREFTRDYMIIFVMDDLALKLRSRRS